MWMNPNNKGYIRATTISSERFIIIGSENIELSGNVIMKNGATLSSGLFNTNSIVPNITNSKSLGTSSKIWSNAYIHDLSINNNIEISGNTIINGVLQAPNIYTNALQVSGNATISGATLYVPSSFTIDPIRHGDNTGTLLINGNLVVQGLTTTINSSVVDISDKMLVLASNASNPIQADGAGFEISGAKVNFLYNNSSASFRSSIGMSISGNVVPVTNSVGSLGESGKIWDIAYIRELNVTNFTNSIQGSKIASETITSTQIMNGTILGTDISNDTITSANIRDGSILTADICDNAITFDKLAYNSVGNTRIINGAVTHEKLSGNCIQSHNIVDGTIVDDDISGNANILGSKLANNSITSDKINQANNWTFSQLTSTRANIQDISATNIEVSGNIVPLRDNSSNLGSSLKRWSNAYIRDISVTNIDVSGNLNPLIANRSSLGSAVKYWNNAYIRDVSISNIDVSGNIVPLLDASSNLGSSLRRWSIAYIRDISTTNIEVSGNIVPLRDMTSNLGSSLKRWNKVFVYDLSVNTINGQAYSAGGGGGGSTVLTSITSNVVPATTNTYNLGSTSKYWSNAYINNLKVSNRVYQEISGDISWSSVNGHYGLAKDAYPSLNPVSSGVKAFQTWTFIQETESMQNVWNSVCWSPQLMLFVAVGGNTGTIIMTSSNGINWTPRTAPEAEQFWCSVCWSPQLMLFVAVGFSGINRAMSSPDGINWTGRGGAALNNREWLSVCWSPELAIFIAVSNGGDVISSSNGADWIVQTVPQQNERTSICWSPELGLFVSVSLGSNILISNNGVNWTSIVAPQASYWKCVCWSSQIGLFVAVSEDGISRIMTSSNGINWTLRIVPQDTDFQHVAWCAELAIFIAIASSSPYRVLTSPDGIIWSLTANADEANWRSFSWSPELGIAVVVGVFDAVMTSSLKGRPPTSYNVFDSSFNSIDENGNWTFTQITMNNANIVDLSVNTINGQAYSAGGGGGSSTDLTSVTSNVVPSTTNTYNLGSTANYWNEAYINILKVSNRVYQEINNNSNWNAVNGHYGLMKTSYPALNPITIMESMTWTRRTHVPLANTNSRKWADVCWSPKLRLFVAVNTTNNANATNYGNIGYSQDGINWNYIYANTNWHHRSLFSVCWSDELGIFVACGQYSLIMYSADGINWSESNPINWNSTRNPEGGAINGYDICWSPQLRLFVIIDKETSEGDKIIVSSNGIDWTSVGINYTDGWFRINLTCICWSPELGIFVALDGYWGGGDKPIASVLTSSDGFNWNIEIIPQQYSTWESVCWSPQLGLFAACSGLGYANSPVFMTSRDGFEWTTTNFREAPFASDWSDIIWCAELGFFVVSSNAQYWAGGGPYMVSSNGIDWIVRDNYEYLAADGLSMTLHSICWSPHLGIIVGVGGASEVSAVGGGGQGGGQIWTTSLKIRPPTISNVFDNSFNRIDENGKWDFSNINVKVLNVTGTFTNTSDDRLKHNEVAIVNGLEIIDSLTPKFYQKTQNMLDASYNGDLSTQAWNYEAGIIAQELLQISDLSFVVSGGDYYQERYIYSRPTNDPSNANYDQSFNIYDISNANYTISNNLITQAYNVNYNSVFVYGLAAIKELHTKVKAQETSISTLQTAMLEQQATINSLLTRLQALDTGAN